MLKVMVVDDSRFARDFAAEILKSNGYSVITAEDGAAAIARYQEQKPPVVVLDITMPDMDGITVLHELVKINPRVRVIMCTALGHRWAIEQSLLKGAVGFLVKPYDPERLVDSVQKAYR